MENFRQIRSDANDMGGSPLEGSRPGVTGSGFENGLLLRVELPSDPKLLCAVRGALERLTEVVGLSAADGRAVTRAVDEALTNIVRHSYAGKTDGLIGIRCSVVLRSADAVKGFEIVMSDRGPAVNPEKMHGRSLEEIKPGGLGLHLIRESMDVVEYRRVGEVNEFRLVKYFVTGKAHPNP